MSKNISPGKISLLVFLYTIEFIIITTIFWIFIFSIGKMHLLYKSKINLFLLFFFQILIRLYQFFYLFFIRYINKTITSGILGYKIDYKKGEEPLFLDVFSHYFLSVFFMTPWKLYYVIYCYFIKLFYNIKLIDIISYIKAEIFNDIFSVFCIVYCAINILIFIIQTIRKSKYVTIAMILRKIEFIKI